MVHVLPDGRIDPAFVVDICGTSGASARSLVLNGRQLIIAGEFTTVNQVTRTGLAWVDASTGQVLPVTSVLTGQLAVQSDSTLFLATAGGLFAIDATTGGAPSGHVLEVDSGPTLRDLGTITLGPGATFAAAGVPPGTYYLRVRAGNASGLSLPSGELVLVVPKCRGTDVR